MENEEYPTSSWPQMSPAPRATSTCQSFRRRVERYRGADLLPFLDNPTVENLVRAGRFRRRVLADELGINTKEEFFHLNDEEQAQLLRSRLPDALAYEMDLAVKDAARRGTNV